MTTSTHIRTNSADLDVADERSGSIATSGPATAPSKHGRFVTIGARAVAVMVGLMIALGLLGATSASADSINTGVRFHSTVVCSTSVDELTVTASSTYRAGSYAMIYLYDYRTGRWIHETRWHNVSGFTALIGNSFNFVGHSRYAVYMRYAQWTTAGWRYTGEYIYTYHQRNANGYGTHLSATCYV